MIKLKFRIHSVWFPEWLDTKMCPIFQCYSKSYNTMYHILLECTRAKQLHLQLIKWWLATSKFDYSLWQSALVNGIPCCLPIKKLSGLLTTTFFIQNLRTIIKTCKLIWRLISQIFLCNIWLQRNNTIFNKKTVFFNRIME